MPLGLRERGSLPPTEDSDAGTASLSSLTQEVIPVQACGSEDCHLLLKRANPQSGFVSVAERKKYFGPGL